MKDDFPWFSEWQGMYMPVGSAIENNIVLALTMVIFTVLGFGFFLMFKLVTEGSKALGKGNVGRGLAYLGLGVSPLVLCAGTMVLGVTVSLAEDRARQERRALAEELVPSFKANPESALTIKWIASGVPVQGGDENLKKYDQYRATNISPVLLGLFHYSQGGNTWCGREYGGWIGPELEAGKYTTFYCERAPEKKPPCISASAAQTRIGEWCLDTQSGEFEVVQ